VLRPERDVHCSCDRASVRYNQCVLASEDSVVVSFRYNVSGRISTTEMHLSCCRNVTCQRCSVLEHHISKPNVSGEIVRNELDIYASDLLTFFRCNPLEESDPPDCHAHHLLIKRPLNL